MFLFNKYFCGNFLKGRFTELKLKINKIEKINHNTNKYYCKYDNKLNFGLPIGNHISIIHHTNEKQLRKSYTPLTFENGLITLLIKIYTKNDEHPLGGELTNYIKNYKEGDYFNISGPKGKVEYLGNKVIKYKQKETNLNSVVMFAGGTGIAPIYQLSDYFNRDNINKKLIFSNKSEDDILLKNDLKLLFKENNVLFLTDKKPDTNDPYITDDKLDTKTVMKFINNNSEDLNRNTYIICGRKEYNEHVNSLLKNLKINEENIIIY